MTAVNSLRTAQLLMVDMTTAATEALAASKAAGKPLQLKLVSSGSQTTAGSASWSGKPAFARSIAFESIFSVNHVDANEMKVNLMERLGKEFGLDLNDFADAGAMAKMIRGILGDMSLTARNAFVREVEHKLGLDDLDISLRDLLTAMDEPGGAADQKLDAVLRAEAGEILKGKEKLPVFKFDEIGRYSVQ